MSAQFVPPRVALVNPTTGMITREWYLLFQLLFSNNGIDIPATEEMLAPVTSTDALISALFLSQDDVSPSVQPVPLSADDISPTPQELYILADDVLPVIGSLRDEIAELKKVVNGLMQGSVVL